MPFQPFAGRHSSHIDMSLHPTTGVVSITVAYHPDNRGGYNCRLYELAPPYTSAPVLKRDWQQGQNGVLGPFGHGASLMLPTGALLVAVPAGIDGPDAIMPTLLMEPNYSAPFTSGGPGPKGDKGDQGLQGIPGATGVPGKDGTNGSGVDPRVDALVSQIGAQGQQLTAIETALGNIGTGEGLSQIDREALDWLAALRAVLRIG